MASPTTATHEAAASFPPVADGVLLVYRMFDIADDIDLARAEAVLTGTAERLRLSGERAGFLDLPDPPLTVTVGERTVTLGDAGERTARVFVRLFAHGVASVRFEFPIPPGTAAAALAALVRCAETGPLEPTARTVVEDLARRLAPAVVAPHSMEIYETYTIVFVRALRGGASTDDVAGADLARVLSGEAADWLPSAQTVADVTSRRFAYATTDLCTFDWDAALIVEPTGDRSVADVLELATAQLLEFRYYDALFEEEMLRMTAVLRRPRSRFSWLFVGRYGRVVRGLQEMVLETTEFVERVENAVRIVGDLYLARVYRAAVERFRIPAWQADVLRRQEAAGRVAAMLRNEAQAALGNLLETSIVALIVLEIVLALI